VGECFFWYRPTRVVPDQRPLNGRCCCCCCHCFDTVIVTKVVASVIFNSSYLETLSNQELLQAKKVVVGLLVVVSISHCFPLQASL